MANDIDEFGYYCQKMLEMSDMKACDKSHVSMEVNCSPGVIDRSRLEVGFVASSDHPAPRNFIRKLWS
ncbi:hypothetical protein M5689_005798 [Euphorbia peplus]|nr:hypothetical protein M5689_005798 [Euphorbia peplus]